MTRSRESLDRRAREAGVRADRERLWSQASTADAGPWHAGSSLTGGLLLYGGGAWLLERWLGWPWLTPAGVLLGLAVALVSIWFRYGVDRSPEPARRSTHDDRPTDPGPMEDAP